MISETQRQIFIYGTNFKPSPSDHFPSGFFLFVGTSRSFIKILDVLHPTQVLLDPCKFQGCKVELAPRLSYHIQAISQTKLASLTWTEYKNKLYV